nr:hypothetical protein [Tanacetum cinerariifolium]
ERGDRVERAATTAASLEAELDSGTINRTQSTTIPNEFYSLGNWFRGSPRRQDTILGDTPAQTRFERLSKQSHEPPLSRVNTLGSREDNRKGCLSFRNSKVKEKSQEVGKEEKVKNSTTQDERRNDQDEGISVVQEDAETQGRQGKDFSGKVTPLFETMLIQHPAEVGEGLGQPTEPQHTPTIASPSHIELIPTISSSQPKRPKNIGKPKERPLRYLSLVDLLPL